MIWYSNWMRSSYDYSVAPVKNHQWLGLTSCPLPVMTSGALAARAAATAAFLLCLLLRPKREMDLARSTSSAVVRRMATVPLGQCPPWCHVCHAPWRLSLFLLLLLLPFVAVAVAVAAPPPPAAAGTTTNPPPRPLHMGASGGSVWTVCVLSSGWSRPCCSFAATQSMVSPSTL